MRKITDIRPVVLAGGLGTRMLPRTEHLPKPLLPVNRKPVLGHVIDAIETAGFDRPIIVVDYLADVVEAFFATDSVDILRVSNATMAEGFLVAADADGAAEAYWGLSSDVILPPRVVREVANAACQTDRSVLILAKLPQAGHKRWNYVVKDGVLQDVALETTRTDVERAGLILARSDIRVVAEVLGRPVFEAPLGSPLAPFQSGWTLILKVLANERRPVEVVQLDLPIWNINVPHDLAEAATFIYNHCD